MLTGCRPNEIQTLPWEVVDLESTKLRLRDARMGARMVPLSRRCERHVSPSPSSLWRSPARRWILITSVLTSTRPGSTLLPQPDIGQIKLNFLPLVAP